MTRAARFARRLRILAAVIREPGLTPSRLARLGGISERTLRRDLSALRHHGYQVTYRDGYQLQESFRFEGAEGPRGLGGVYLRQVELMREELPAALAGAVEADLEAEAPAALAALIAGAIERRRA